MAVLGAVAQLLATSPDRETALPSPDAESQEGARAPVGRGTALLADAEALLNRGDSRGARETFVLASEAFAGQGDRAGVGHATLGLARVHHLAGKGDEARAHYEEALILYRESGSGADEARALMARGDLEADTFQWDAAARFYRAGRQAWARVPPPKSDSHVLLQMDQTPSMPEGEEEARAVLAQAELLLRDVGDAEALADVFRFRGDLEWNLGDPAAARPEYAQAASLYAEAGNREREGFATLRGAECETHLGYNVVAKALLARAETAFDETASAAGEALARAARGDLSRLLGELAAARTHYAAAAESLASLGHPAEAWTLSKLGEVAAHSGDAAAATEALEAAARLFAEAADPAGAASAWLGLGQLAAGAGNNGAAREWLQRAVDLAAEAGELRTEARALLALAAVASRENDATTAQSAVAAAEARFDAAQVPLGAVLAALGRGEVVVGDAESAAEAYGEAASLLAALDDPVAEANRYLGLPPVSRIDLVSTVDPNQDIGGDEPNPAAIARFEAALADNSAAYPDHNREARALVAEIEARIERAGVGAN